MPLFAPETLAADCGGTWHGRPAAPVTGFAHDTRILEADELFVALRTGARDGHDFLAAAAARGASTALVSRLVPEAPLAQLLVADTLAALHALARHHRIRFSGPVVGVTGSAGKTSTKDLLGILLGAGGDVLATAGNLNNHLGVPLTLLRLDLARHRAAVVEAGISGPGEMDVLADLIAPDVAVVTMVGPAHLDRLGSLDGVAAEKVRLPAAVRARGVAVFPSSCLAHPAFRDLAVPALVTVPADASTAALPEAAQAVPHTITHGREATTLRLTWRGGVEAFEIRRVSTGMAGNAALAVAAALHLGVSADLIRRRLASWVPAALRGEVVRAEGATVYLDCYNANPASMLDALEAFLALAEPVEPRLFVVGCMEELGASTAALHRATGAKWPLRAGDVLVVLGEQAEAFAEGARASGGPGDILVNPDRGDVARLIGGFRGAVFLKGSRRHALETLLAGGPARGGHGKEVAAAC